MLSILCVRLTIKVKVGIPESFKVGWYPPKKTGSSHLNCNFLSHVFFLQLVFALQIQLIHVLDLRMTFWSCVRSEEDFRSRVRLENDCLVVR